MKRMVFGVAFALICGAAAAEPSCPGKPNALGVSRELVVGAGEYFRLGKMQYRQTLPLADREVVLTFDDGPLPPYSDRILNILAAQCVKATFFLVGRQARANPAAVRRIYNAGHTIGTHSQNHPLRTMSEQQAGREIDDGIESVITALGNANALAPFFRVPGLLRTPHIEAQAKARELVVWSSDTVADDWRNIDAEQVLHLALSRLEREGRGVLLLHDIQPRTVLMLPTLLSELKRRGFKIVHVVPEGERPVLSQPTMVASAVKEAWPRVIARSASRAAEAAPAAAAAAGIEVLPPVRPVRRAAAASAPAEQLSAAETRNLIAGEQFNAKCYEGTSGRGRINSDGSVDGYISISGIRPPGVAYGFGFAFCDFSGHSKHADTAPPPLRLRNLPSSSASASVFADYYNK